MIAARNKQRSPTRSTPRTRKPTRVVSKDRQIVFAHRSEEELAKLLDFYHLSWKYEPSSFPVEWNDEGTPTKFFTPDFYLPEYDLYLEVTTIKQKLITRKHQKLRRFQQLYPDVKIKLLNVSDFSKLMMKYGRSPRNLAGSLGNREAKSPK